MGTVSDLRITALRFDLTPQLFGAPAHTALPILTTAVGYAAAFAAAGAETGALRLPWRFDATGAAARNHFWQRYLDREDLATVDAMRARRFDLPLRLADSVQISGITAELYLYPYGTAALAQVRLEGSFDLPDVVDLAADQRPALDNAARRALDDIRKERLGTAGGPAPVRDSFVVATVVAGTGFDSETPISEQSTIHRALAGLCSGDPQWAKNMAAPLASSTIRTRHAPGSVLYRDRRARALWFPEHFTSPKRPLRRLSCYHRNQTYLAMQVEARAAITCWAAAQLDDSGSIPVASEGITREAANCLGRMYGWTPDTYRSWSTTAQIADNHYLAAINAVRGHNGMLPIAAELEP